MLKDYEPRYLKTEISKSYRGSVEELTELRKNIERNAIKHGTPLSWLQGSCGDCTVPYCSLRPHCGRQ